jgi:hypothetical protein
MNAAPMPIIRENPWRFTGVALLVAASAAFFWHPLAMLMFACLIAVVTPTEDFKWLFLAVALSLFAILNVSRQLDGDLVTYVQLQDFVSQRPLYGLLDKEELQLISGTYRLTEIGFYAPAWLMSQVLPDSKSALVITATLGIYIPTFLGLILIGRTENWSKGLILTVALFTFFAGINFIQSTHLIRQYMSSAMLFYSFALFISRRYKWALLVAFYACTVHNGTALLIPLVAGVCWMFRYRERRRIGIVGFSVRILGMAMLLAATTVVVPILAGELASRDIPNINLGHYAVVGGFFLIAHYAIQLNQLRLRSLTYARLAFISIFLLSLGYYVLGIQVYALRYFAYLEWLYGLMLGAIMFTMFRNHRGLQVFARVTVSLAAAAILIARIAAAEWLYGPGDNYLLSWDFFQVAQLVSR